MVFSHKPSTSLKQPPRSFPVQSAIRHQLVAETGLEPASTDYESVPGGFTTPVYSASKLQTGYGGRIRTYVNEFQRLAPFQLGHSVRILEFVDLARFERATSTFAESRSHSAELQVRKIGGGDRT